MGTRMRSLLGLNHGGHEEHSTEHADHVLDEHLNESTLDLRVASIFVILFGASLLGLLTLKFKSPDAPFPRLMRAFSGGIILALALVHIIPEAVGTLNSLMDFPIGGCTILFGIIILVLIDNSLSAMLAPESYKQQIKSDSHHAHDQHHQHRHDGSNSAHKTKKGHSHSQHMHGSRSSDTDGQRDHSSSNGHHSCSSNSEPVVLITEAAEYDNNGAKTAVGVTSQDGAADAESALQQVTGQQPHGHQCMRSINTSSWLTSATAPMRNIKQCVTAYTMELGCIFHSVIIGIGVGVITSDRQLVTTLMVALTIHQGLEALALGSVLGLAQFPVVKKVVMLMMYSLTTPIGIAVGIAISASYDPASVTSRAVTGTLNGISGGMLLYIGMYQLVAEEFSREDLLVRPKLRLGMYLALLLGAVCMCVLGIWS